MNKFYLIIVTIILILLVPLPTYAATITQFDRWIDRYFPAEAQARARLIMSCESSNDPKAIGDLADPIHSYGLFQIRVYANRPSYRLLLLPRFNIWYASELYKAQGWGIWGCNAKV